MRERENMMNMDGRDGVQKGGFGHQDIEKLASELWLSKQLKKVNVGERSRMPRLV